MHVCMKSMHKKKTDHLKSFALIQSATPNSTRHPFSEDYRESKTQTHAFCPSINPFIQCIFYASIKSQPQCWRKLMNRHHNGAQRSNACKQCIPNIRDASYLAAAWNAPRAGCSWRAFARGSSAPGKSPRGPRTPTPNPWSLTERETISRFLPENHGMRRNNSGKRRGKAPRGLYLLLFKIKDIQRARGFRPRLMS